PEQKDFLDPLKAACADAQSRNRFANWVQSVYHDWFLRWPERVELWGNWQGPLTLEQHLTPSSTRPIQKISTWFYNHKKRSRDTFVLPAAITAELAKGGRTRCPQAREVWCRLFYDDSMKAAIQGHLDAARNKLGRKLTRKERMKITRTRTDEFFEAASDDVLAIVNAQLEKETDAKKNPPPPRRTARYRRGLPESTKSRLTPALACRAAIEAAPRIIEKLLRPVVTGMGYTVSVFGAGPCPSQGGAIRSFA
ncbi:hypothetical protein C8T65DRAFT_579062, partial [Cerioporus squamosus]